MVTFNDYRDHHPWNPETGGYRDDGCFYGTKPNLPAKPGATYETDSRTCSACGQQRIFDQPPACWWNWKANKPADGPGESIVRQGFEPASHEAKDKCAACVLKS